MKHMGNAIKIRYIGQKLSRAQDQGLRFWQTNSFAIITYTKVLGDCIDRMEIECFFERLATPRPAPKVTLKSKWQTQQQQQPNLEDDVQSIWKQRATWESRAGVRYDTKHATEVERATRKLALPTTEAEAETHLTVKEEHIDTM